MPPKNAKTSSSRQTSSSQQDGDATAVAATQSQLQLLTQLAAQQQPTKPSVEDKTKELDALVLAGILTEGDKRAALRSFVGVPDAAPTPVASHTTHFSDKEDVAAQKWTETCIDYIGTPASPCVTKKIRTFLKSANQGTSSLTTEERARLANVNVIHPHWMDWLADENNVSLASAGVAAPCMQDFRIFLAELAALCFAHERRAKNGTVPKSLSGLAQAFLANAEDLRLESLTAIRNGKGTSPVSRLCAAEEAAAAAIATTTKSHTPQQPPALQQPHFERRPTYTGTPCDYCSSKGYPTAAGHSTLACRTRGREEAQQRQQLPNNNNNHSGSATNKPTVTKRTRADGTKKETE